jgi:hypothetical protein
LYDALGAASSAVSGHESTWNHNSFLTSETSHADVVVDGDFTQDGFLKRSGGSGSYTVDTNTYVTVEELTTVSGIIITDHGLLSGLGDDDHTQYILVDGSRGFTATVSGVSPTEDDHLATKSYVDGAVTSGIGVLAHSSLTGLDADDHTQYILVDGTRAFTSTVSGVSPIEDAHLTTKQYVDDSISTLSGSIVLDHGGLEGLGDDDHTQYILVDGSRAFTSTVSGVSPTEDAHLATKYYIDQAIAGLPSPITDHGGLTGLGDDDHTQYLNTTRGDARYYTESEVDTISGSIVSQIVTNHSELNELDYASSGHTGFQPAGDYVTDVEMTTISGDIIAQIPTDYYTTGQVDVIIETTSGTLQDQIDEINSSVAGVIFWMWDEVSDLPGYEHMKTSPSTNAEDTDTIAITAAEGEKFIEGYVTVSGGGVGNIIPGGVWDFSIYASVSNDAGDTSIVARVYKRSQVGVETELFNCSTGVINGSSPTLYTIRSVQGDFVLASTDRLVIKFFGLTTSVPSLNLTYYYQGDTNYTHVDTPAQAIIINDHGDLIGLDDDDHIQYILANGTRAFTSTVSGVAPTEDAHLSTKLYVDDAISTLSGSIVFDHGDLTGLSDDDHTQYILADGTRAFTGTVSGVAPTEDAHLTTKSYVDALTSGSHKQGRTSISNDAYGVSVVFAEAFADTDYSISVILSNVVDPTPSIYPMIITTKSGGGFTAEFSGKIRSANYYLEWIAKHD